MVALVSQAVEAVVFVPVSAVRPRGWVGLAAVVMALVCWGRGVGFVRLGGWWGWCMVLRSVAQVVVEECVDASRRLAPLLE